MEEKWFEKCFPFRCASHISRFRFITNLPTVIKISISENERWANKEKFLRIDKKLIKKK